MRRILSFLLLTVIAFALPHKVAAWNFSSNTESPYRIELVFDSPYSKVMPMTFNVNTWSTEVFTAQTETLTFLMRPYWGKNDGECFDIGNYNYTATPESDYVEASSSGSGDAGNPDNRYKLAGLKVGSKYRIDITGGDTTFKYRVVEILPDNLYLYTNKDVEEGKEVRELASAANDNGTFTFNLYLEKGTFLFLSRNAGATTWGELGNDFGRFNPDGKDEHLPGNDSSFTSNNSGSWYIPTTGIYTVTVNWGAHKLSATNEITLYGSSPHWATKRGQATPTEYGKYVFTVDLDADEYLVLSWKNDGHSWNDINGFIWAPEKDTEAVSNIKTYFVKKNKDENGAWHVTKGGKYAIEVDCNQKSFKVFEVTVHMPLTSVDFAGGKKHYFLVGERMGEWHLQPEWEFKEVNGELVLNSRFIYNGAFAVGVVDNYDDYIHHTFTYYCQDQKFTADVTSSNGDISGTGRVYRQGKGKTRFNPSGSFYAKFDGEDGKLYFEGRGTYMSEIKVALNGSKLPSRISFTKGTLQDAAKNRMFTLVGDNIINRKYNNTSGTANTTMYNRGYDGWFDSWIQYDPATNTPYVDANGEYLYHTSFTPDYLTTHPVRFNLELQNGNEFAYSSRNVQFVQWSNLPNLDSDPYKDFYQAFSGREKIYNSGATKAYGNEYNFKLNVECNNPETTPTADWNCYVVRDLWVGGLIKFWSGWGGNEDATNNGYDHLAVWHGPNGGPDIAEGEKYDVKGYDVKSGLPAVLYKNVARRGATDYRISDGKPVYFNRVVLWYTNSDGVSNSYIQFIQESAGPAIFAQTVQNEADTSKKNYIKYHWYLNKSQNETGKDAKVVSYEIERFRIVDGKPQPTGYPEGEKVDISDKNVTVEQLYEENAGNLAFTTHIDKGILDDRGFAPGLYEYVIYVTDEHGGRKMATSNRVAIYDDELVTPNVVAMQLVELRGYYEDKYGTEHAASETVLKEALEKAGLNADIVRNKKYLTYRVNDNDNFYIMEDIVDAEGKNIPVGVEIINSKVALDFLNSHPDKYWWTSDYYVRCLDYNRYSNILQGYIDNKMIKETSIPEPRLEVFDVIVPEGGGTSVRRSRGNASRFDFGGQSYYSAIVKRGGNLADATFDVTLNYDYTTADNEKKSPTTHAATGIDPVTPRPFMPLYRYVYQRPDRDVSGYEWGKIKVPVNNWKGNQSTGDAILNGDMDFVYVKLDDRFDPRNFTLQVDFYRPNVNEEIYKFYDITYYVNMVNDDSEIDKDLAVPLNVEAVLHDENMTDADLVTPNRYRMEFKGMHPRNGVYPKVEFVRTEYVPNSASSAETGEVYKSQTGNFGEMLTINAKRTAQVTENSDGLKKVHLGKIKRDNGTWDWMYKGHEDFKDNDPTLEATYARYEDKSTYDPESDNYTPIKPVYYLIELKNSTDEYTYKFLVPHVEGHHKGEIETDKNGLIINDSDPLIGTYIAKGLSSDETPAVYATAIYIFERPLNGTDTGEHLNFNRLEVVSLKVNGNETVPGRNADKANRVKKDVSDEDFALNGAGELPAADFVPADKVLDMSAADGTTGYNSYIAVKGITYKDASGGIVTGVEDIIAGLETGKTVYYNLQGIRIDKPTETGVYLRVDSNGVNKIVIK